MSSRNRRLFRLIALLQLRDSTTFEPKTALIQISTKTVDYLVYPNEIDPNLVSSLNSVTDDNNILKIIHDCREDIKYLFRDFDLKFQHVYDTQAAAEILSKRSKYSSLLLEYFEIDVVNLKNSYQRYNWSNRNHPNAALKYAQIDSHYLIPLHEKLEIESTNNSLIVEIDNEINKRLSMERAGRRRFKNNLIHIMNEYNKRRTPSEKITLSDTQYKILDSARFWRFTLSESLGLIDNHVLSMHVLIDCVLSCKTPADLRTKMKGNKWIFGETLTQLQHILFPSTSVVTEEFLALNAFEKVPSVLERSVTTTEVEHGESVFTPVQNDFIYTSKRGKTTKRKINFNLFICGLPWSCKVQQIVRMFRKRGYKRARVNMENDRHGCFTGLAFVHVPDTDLNKILDDHHRHPFFISKKHALKMKRMLSNVPLEDKLTRCVVSPKIKIIFAPLYNDISSDLILTWFQHFGSISHVESCFDTNVQRTVAKIRYEHVDSVDQILEACPCYDLHLR
ncbi:unnamed protein product, partial [Didymodactylos carnosus]